MNNHFDPYGQDPTANLAEKEENRQAAAEPSGFLQRKAELLKTAYGWTSERTRGYVDGAACRLSGSSPSKYALVGLDEYALGFRAGYYNR